MDRQDRESAVTVMRSRGRGQESASLYVPPPLRLKANSSPTCKETAQPARSTIRETLLKELCGDSSVLKSKKCENSYMLFDMDAPKPATSMNNPSVRRIPPKSCTLLNGDMKFSDTPPKKSSQHRIKMCDNSYLLFSDKDDEDDNGGSNGKKYLRSSKPSVRLQDGHRKAASTHHLPSLDLSDMEDAKKSSEPKRGEVVDDISCQLGVSRISSQSNLLFDRPKEALESAPRFVQSSQKKCDNSILLFDEDNSNSSPKMELSRLSGGLRNISRNENESFRYVPLSNGTVEDGHEGLAQAPSRKRPPSNEITKDGEIGESIKEGPKVCNIEDSNKTSSSKSVENSPNNTNFDAFESIEDYVVEFYDFPTALKTQDFMTFFSCYIQEGFYIKWVDETHALGVFTNPFSVTEVLKKSYDLLKVRLLSEALEKSQEIANSIPIPCASRPRTCPSLARRLVSGALGLKVAVPDSVREAEKKMLQDAKAERKLAAKQREEAWEGTLRSSLGTT